jgi:hypothetical protein
MSKQHVHDAAVRNRGEALRPAVEDAHQLARDRIPAACSPVRGLWIVTRDQVSLYEALQYAYRESWRMTVLLDRRQGERRQSAQPVAGERRWRDRRRPPSRTDDLCRWGYVLVRPDHRRPQDS